MVRSARAFSPKRRHWVCYLFTADIVKTILQNRLSGLYLDRSGLWVADSDAAFSFGNCGRAVDYCLKRRLWGTRVILMLAPDTQSVVMTLDEMSGSLATAQSADISRAECF